MVAAPGDYRWCSHACNAHGSHEPRITPHRAYLQLGADDASRQGAYRELFIDDLAAKDLEGVRLHTHQQKVWGSDRFQRQIEALNQRAATVRPRGRPKTLGE